MFDGKGSDHVMNCLSQHLILYFEDCLGEGLLFVIFNTGLSGESKRMSKIDSPVDTCREATKTEEGSFLNKEDSQTYTSGSVASPGTELHTAALN